MNGLDGIRAFAVLAVMGVHQEFTWLPGGFYGVDAFFVLSGFLITTLLVRELGERGSIRLGAFWLRRARRLLPAVLVLVLVVAVLSATVPWLIGTTSFPGALATLFYSANWYLTFQHASYFAATAAPSPLLHTWSLAIEEQFYLLWPLVILAVTCIGRRRAGEGAPLRRRLHILLVLSVLGAVGSAALMWTMTRSFADPSRAYYGTETRLQGILVGSALALALILWGRPLARAGRVVATFLALAGAAVTALMWTRVSELSPFAFHGGFLVVSVASATVVACVASIPKGVVARALGLWPLRQLGVISYGVYLWYWPVILAMTPQRVPFGPYGLFAARLATTIALATTSYFLVERPIRYGRLPRPLRVVVLPIGAALTLAVTAVTLVPAAAVATSAVHLPAPAVKAGSHDLRVLVTGDSMAGSLAVGLAGYASRRHVEVVNDGHPGCSMSQIGEDKLVMFQDPPGVPCSLNDPNSLFEHWQQVVDRFNPDVVIYLARCDLLDQEVNGQWQHIDEPAFDAYLARRYRQGVQVLGSRGAAVVLLTTPVYQAGETANDPWPEDQLARVLSDNTILRQVTAAFVKEAAHRTVASTSGAHLATVSRPAPPSVHLFDLDGLVTPGNRFVATRNGVTLRCQDGVHFTAQGGAYVGRHLVPLIEKLGQEHHQLHPTGKWPGTPPPLVPGWYQRLPCSS